MSFKPEDIRIPWNEYNTIKKEEPKAPPPMYDQRFVDALKDEVEHYKRLYRQELLKNRGQ